MYISDWVLHQFTCAVSLKPWQSIVLDKEDTYRQSCWMYSSKLYFSCNNSMKTPQVIKLLFSSPQLITTLTSQRTQQTRQKNIKLLGIPTSQLANSLSLQGFQKLLPVCRCFCCGLCSQDTDIVLGLINFLVENRHVYVDYICKKNLIKVGLKTLVCLQVGQERVRN